MKQSLTNRNKNIEIQHNKHFPKDTRPHAGCHNNRYTMDTSEKIGQRNFFLLQISTTILQVSPSTRHKKSGNHTPAFRKQRYDFFRPNPNSFYHTLTFPSKRNRQKQPFQTCYDKAGKQPVLPASKVIFYSRSNAYFIRRPSSGRFGKSKAQFVSIKK